MTSRRKMLFDPRWDCIADRGNPYKCLAILVCYVAPACNLILGIFRPVLVPIVAAIALLCWIIFAANNREKSPEFLTGISFLSLIELSVVIAAACVSTINFQRSTARIDYCIPVETRGSCEWYALIVARLCEQLFAILNVILFVLAIISLLYPFWHLFTISVIYWAFSLNNYVQSRLAFPLIRSRVHGISRILDLQHWLKSENGPATVGYAAVMCVLAFLSHKMNASSSGSRMLPEIWKNPDVLGEVVVAFSSGVAGYHLALSTLGYLIGHPNHPSRIIDNHPEAFVLSTHLETDLEKQVKSAAMPWVTTLAILTAFIVAWVFGNFRH